MHFLMGPDDGSQPPPGARAARAGDFENFRKFSPAGRARRGFISEMIRSVAFQDLTSVNIGNARNGC
jgi:hypothetical protein